MGENKRLLLAVTFVPGLIWGASFLFMAEGLAILPPAGVTFVRIALGFLALGLFPSARKPVAHGDWGLIAALAVTWFAFPLTVFPLAEQHVSTALAGLLNGGTPLFVVAAASLRTRRLPGRAVLTATLVGLSGLALIAAPSLAAGSSELTSTLAILAAVASYGIAGNIAGPLQRRNGALPVVWRALGIALVLTAPLGAPSLLQFHWETGPVLSMLALGLLGTALATVILTSVAGRVSATAASAPIFMIPIVSLLLGVAVLGESVSMTSIAGGAVCMVAAWLLARARAQAPEASAAEVIRLAARGGRLAASRPGAAMGAGTR